YRNPEIGQRPVPVPTDVADELRTSRPEVGPDLGPVVKTVADETKKNGGATVALDGSQPTKGFIFAPDKATETKVPLEEFNSGAAIEKFAQDHLEELQQPGAHIGSWIDDNGVPTLDISHVVDDKLDALVRARA